MEERISEPAAVTELGAVLEQSVEPQLPTPWYRRRNPLIAVAAVVVAAGVGIGLAVGSGSSSITVKGSISLSPLGSGDSANPSNATDGDPCTATGGYSDITQGATVTIGGAQGQTLAVGALSAGKEANVDDSLGIPAGDCVFSFAVSVPAGQSAYTITVSHRGTQTVTPAQAQAGVALTLGS